MTIYLILTLACSPTPGFLVDLGDPPETCDQIKLRATLDEKEAESAVFEGKEVYAVWVNPVWPDRSYNVERWKRGVPKYAIDREQVVVVGQP